MVGDGLRRRSFVVRYLTLFGGEVGSKACVLLAFAYLARVLGPQRLGAVELALSMTIFFVLAAEIGLGSYGARVVETAPHRAAELVPRASLLRAMIAIPAYAVILAISVYRDSTLLALYGLTVLLTPFNTQWVFQGLRQMQWVAAGSFARYGTFAALVLFLVRPGSDIRIVAAAEVSGALALAALNTVLLTRVLKLRLDWRGAMQGAIDLFRQAWFLGASDLTWAAMWYSPMIIIGWIDPSHTEYVGWLAASIRIVMALHAFVFLYFFNLVPNLSRELHQGIDAWRGLIRRSLSVSMWPACFIAAAGTLAAPVGMLLLFGNNFEQAVLPFQIVIWMIPIAWLSGHFRFSLIVAGHQRLEFTASLVAGIATAAARGHRRPDVRRARSRGGAHDRRPGERHRRRPADAARDRNRQPRRGGAGVPHLRGIRSHRGRSELGGGPDRRHGAGVRGLSARGDQSVGRAASASRLGGSVMSGRGVRRIGIGLVLLLVAPFAAFFLVRGVLALANTMLERKYPPPGQMVQVGNHQLHLYCQGRGTPTVVIEPGLGVDWVSWEPIVTALAPSTEVCVYDRAGYGWSEAGPMPRTAERSAVELHELLTRSHHPGPYVIVAHSFGGHVARVFAGRFGTSLRSLVLVDPSEMARADMAAPADTGPAPRRPLGVRTVIDMLPPLGWERVKRLYQGESVLPPRIQRLPPPFRQRVVVASSLDQLDAEQSELASSRPSQQQAWDATMPPDLAVVVITPFYPDESGRVSETPEALARRKRHLEIAQASTHGSQVFAERSGHMVHMDQPELVLSVIRDVLTRAPGAAR